MRLIFVLRGYHPGANPHKVGDFEWSEKHQAYVWQGRELKPAEFNEVVNDVFDRNHDLWAHPVTVRVLTNDDNLAKARATLAVNRAKKKLSNPSSHVLSPNPNTDDRSLAGVHPPSGGGSD